MRFGSLTGRAATLLSLAAIFLIVSVMLVLTDDASGRTIHVPGEESTIQAAIDKAGYGDTVMVSNGVYDEELLVNKVIDLRGASQERVTLTSSLGTSVITLRGHDVTVSDLRIEGNSLKIGIDATSVEDVKVMNVTINGCSIGIRVNECSNLLVKGCTVKNSDGKGLHIIGNDRVPCEGVTISDSTFEKNKGPGVTLDWCQWVRMDRLTVLGNGGWGVVSDHSDNAHLRNSSLRTNGNGLGLIRCHGWKVEDNVIRNNRWHGIELNHSGSARDNIIRNNLITDNSKTSGSTASGILFYGRDASDNLVEANTITHNPIGLHYVSTNGMCWHNTIKHNKIKSNQYGIWEADGTGPNHYYLNIFADNDVQARDVNALSTFDDGELGNYWSDYQLKNPGADREGPVWLMPYLVSGRSTAYDTRPLAYKYEQVPPEIVDIQVVAGQLLVPGETASFDVLATDGSAITGYQWTVTLPGGKEVTYQTDYYRFSFTFTKPGLHWLTVKVTDVWGLSATLTEQFNIEDNVVPVADAGADLTVDVGTIVTLDGTGSSDNHGIASISWVFDPDGQALRYGAPIFSIKMEELGTYKAVLFVVDFSGNSASDTMYIFVKDLHPPVASVAPVDTKLSLGETVVFDGSPSTDNVGIDTWLWTAYHEGRQLRWVRAATINHTFDEMGGYAFVLKVTDAAGHSDSIEIEVEVVDTEPPTAEAGPDQRVLMGTEVFFSSTGSVDNVGITRYEWSFNYQRQLHVVTGRVSSYRFDLPGEYLVTLVVYDGTGNHDSDNMRVTVVDTVSPEAKFWSPEQARMGETIILDASGSEDNLGVRSYEWSVVHHGTIEVLEGVMTEYTFGRPGPYTFTLTVSDAAGNEDTEQRTYTIASEETQADMPAWLVPSMVATLVASFAVSWYYSKIRSRPDDDGDDVA